MNRTTLDFTDPNTGKKAVINYQSVSLQVEQTKALDRLYVYLLPDKLSSFMRLTGTNGNYSEKLNELITLTGIGQKELEEELNKTGNQTQVAALAKENAFFLFDIRDQKRQGNNLTLKQLRNKLVRLIFPCEEFVSQPIVKGI